MRKDVGWVSGMLMSGGGTPICEAENGSEPFYWGVSDL